jgi:hypothetical protein
VVEGLGGDSIEPTPVYQTLTKRPSSEPPRQEVSDRLVKSIKEPTIIRGVRRTCQVATLRAFGLHEGRLCAAIASGSSTHCCQRLFLCTAEFHAKSSGVPHVDCLFGEFSGAKLIATHIRFGKSHHFDSCQNDSGGNC